MKIHETRRDMRHPNGSPQTFTAVLVESVADDVAAYYLPGDHASEHVAAHGHKLTERVALAAGFTIPAGKHYRR